MMRGVGAESSGIYTQELGFENLLGVCGVLMNILIDVYVDLEDMTASKALEW